MSKRVVILGGGMSGIVALWALRDLDPLLIEATGRLGGSFGDGGLKLLRATPSVETMLADLGVPHERYTPRGGLLALGIVEPHPQWFREQTAATRDSLQDWHWAKTRQGARERDPLRDGLARTTCMDDPMGNGPQQALKYSQAILGANVLGHFAGRLMMDWRVTSILDGWLCVDSTFGGKKREEQVPFDFLVITLPLWISYRLAKTTLGYRLPERRPTTLVILDAYANTVQTEEKLSRWDYIYTPTLHAVHRIVVGQNSRTAQLEVASHHPVGNVLSDLQTLRAYGFDLIQEKMSATPGHVVPNWGEDERPKVPDNVLLLGRYAEWEPRALTHTSLERVLEWRAKNLP